MGIFEVERNAEVLGIDSRDVERIKGISNSIDGMCSRDNRRVVQNGLHNICRYYILGHGKFAPWLAKALPSAGTFGIYIAKARTERWKINDRMSIAADVGKLPSDISRVAVIRVGDADEALAYARRAEEKLGAKFAIVHDESGKRDGEALLAACDIEEVGFTRALDEKGKLTRYTGACDDSRMLDIYRWNAAQVCREALSTRMNDMFRTSEKYVEALCIPDQLVSVLTCGRKQEGFSTKCYNTSDVPEPRSYENASYNVPYSYFDRRAFTFPDSEPLLDDFYEHSDKLNEICDMVKIWQYAADCAGEGAVVSLGKMFDASLRTKMTKYKRMCNRYGIEPMVNSYYSGVPLEDIIA